MVERVAFLYHYIPPLLLTFLGAGIAFDLVTVRLARSASPTPTPTPNPNPNPNPTPNSNLGTFRHARLRPFRPFVHYGRGSGGGSIGGGGGGGGSAAAVALDAISLREVLYGLLPALTPTPTPTLTPIPTLTLILTLTLP